MEDPLRILLVDDDEVDRMAVRRLLERIRKDVVIDEVVDVASGIEALGRVHYDCAIVDYLLPDGDGVGFMKKAAGRERRATPIIVLTGKGDREIDLEVMEAGGADFLEKEGLSARVLDRTVRYAVKNSLLVQRLQEANQKLVALDRLKSEFLATASHELRTPLTIIREFVSLVRDGITGPVSDEQKDCLDSAIKNCDRLGAIINNLLDLQRVESGKVQMRRKKVDLNRLLQGCCRDFQPSFASKKQTLRLEESMGLPEVLCDEQQIIRVLVNLIGNAHKFTPEGGWVAVRAHIDAGRVMVEVEDNGSGIGSDDLERIFDKFTQINREAGPGTQGTGLGLAITKKIVELHEGEIKVTSELAKGSRFTFSLPVYEKDMDLRAFIKDHIDLPGLLGKDWSLVLLKLVEQGDSLPVDLLVKAEGIADQTLRQSDGALLLEQRGVLSFMIQSDERGTSVAMERVVAALFKGLDREMDLYYVLFQDPGVDLWKEALQAPFKKLDRGKNLVFSLQSHANPLNING
jgi:signal transduction histidine kinase